MLCGGCEDVLSDFYDEPRQVVAEAGFLSPSDGEHEGIIVVDVRSYSRWVYLDFHSLTIDSADMLLAEETPSHWDIALHRYDACTHHGAAAVLPASDLATAENLLSLVSFTPDVDSLVVTDMSQMVDGILGYTSTPVNPVLSCWMDVDLSIMPPHYTPSERVYLVRLSDESVVALRFDKYKSAEGVKGILTLHYRYPLSTPSAPLPPLP